MTGRSEDDRPLAHAEHGRSTSSICISRIGARNSAPGATPASTPVHPPPQTLRAFSSTALKACAPFRSCPPREQESNSVRKVIYVAGREERSDPDPIHASGERGAFLPPKQGTDGMAQLLIVEKQKLPYDRFMRVSGEAQADRRPVGWTGRGRLPGDGPHDENNSRRNIFSRTRVQRVEKSRFTGE